MFVLWGMLRGFMIEWRRVMLSVERCWGVVVCALAVVVLVAAAGGGVAAEPDDGPGTLIAAHGAHLWVVQHKPDGKFLKHGAERFEWLEAGAGQADELADWIEGKVETHRGEGTNGYKALEMCHAVYESARTRERVVLPVRTLVNPLDLMVESGQLPVRFPGRYDIRSALLRGENMASDEENR